MQLMVQATARKYAQESLLPAAAAIDREHRFPKQQLAELVELGLMGSKVPPALGGDEAGAVAHALALMELSQGCASQTVTLAVNNMVAETICKFGDEKQQQKYVPEIT